MGYGLQLAGDARRQMAEAKTDLGVFTCERHLQAFYERAGWRCLPGTVLIGGTPETPFPSDRFEKVTMAAFFSPRANTSAESFIRSRIELYPGGIDKLWWRRCRHAVAKNGPPSPTIPYRSQDPDMEHVELRNVELGDMALYEAIHCDVASTATGESWVFKIVLDGDAQSAAGTVSVWDKELLGETITEIG